MGIADRNMNGSMLAICSFYRPLKFETETLYYPMLKYSLIGCFLISLQLSYRGHSGINYYNSSFLPAEFPRRLLIFHWYKIVMYYFIAMAWGLKWASLTFHGVGAMIWALVLGLSLIFEHRVMSSCEAQPWAFLRQQPAFFSDSNDTASPKSSSTTLL